MSVPPITTDPQDIMVDYTRNLFLFYKTLELVVEERIFLENNRPPALATDIHMQVLMDTAMTSVHQMTHGRLQEVFARVATNPVEHSIRYAAGLLVAEKLAGVLNIPPSHFAACFMCQMLKKFRPPLVLPA